MINTYRIKYLKLRSRIYAGLLVLLSSLSIAGFYSCNEVVKDSKNTDDNPDIKLKNLESELKAKNDSLTRLKKDIARIDSMNIVKRNTTRKTDSIIKKNVQKPKYVPSQPAVDYGVIPNFNKPGVGNPKNQ